MKYNVSINKIKVYQYIGVHLFESIWILFNDLSSEYEGRASFVNSTIALTFLLTITNILFIVGTKLGFLIIVHCIILFENFSNLTFQKQN